MAYKDAKKRRQYAKAHYEANKETYKKRAAKFSAANRMKLKKYVRDFLLKNPCKDCGEKDIIVLEFDHRDATEKMFNIGDAVRNCVSIKTIQAEMDKCDVRCANCHRRRTHQNRRKK